MAKVHHLNIPLVSGNLLSLDFMVQDGQIVQTVLDDPFTIQERDGITGIHIDPEYYENYSSFVESFWDVKIPEGEAAFFPIAPETAQQIQDFVSKLG